MEIIIAIMLIGALVFLYWPNKNSSYYDYKIEEDRKGCVVFIISVVIGVLMLFV